MIETKNVPYRLPVKEHRDLKSFCATHGMSMQEFLDRAVHEYRKKWIV